MSTSYYADRINLYWLMQQHPDWTQEEYARAVKRSKSWVGKWQGHLRPISIGDAEALHQTGLGQSRARKHPPERIDSCIEAEILAIRDATEAFRVHYNTQRPNQARSCENRPPLVAFPHLEPLPPPPQEVKVDGWLKQFEGFHVERKVDAHGQVHLDLRSYYVDVHRAGQRVTLHIQAESRSLLIWQEGTLLKTIPLRGFSTGSSSFARFVESMIEQARAQHRLCSFQERKKRVC